VSPAEIRQDLAKVRRLRERAERLRAEAGEETRRVLREAQRTKGVTLTEAAKAIGLTRDGAYKALRGGD
jgi:hypothetical protein